MKKHSLTLLPLLASASSVAVAAPPVTTPNTTPLAVPTTEQRAWHDAEIGLFFHWAPNVYQGGEGDNLSTPRERINPDRFDAAQWMDAVKAANAGYMIFVAKHIGGYCAWQTATTDYSLKTSPWRGGKGDMVAELAKTGAQRGVRLGVYLSPRDDTHGIRSGGHAATPEKQAAYNEIYRRQLTEILTNYGPMFEMWFDGGNIVPINDLLDKHAPGVISFQGRRTGGSRWVGTEHGFAPYPCWNTIDWKAGETPKEGAGTPTGNLWCPAECDVSILRPRWFWSPGSDARILSLDALMEIYYMSVGRGVNLLLNVAPDDHGQIPPAQMTRLKELGDEVRARFAKPLFSTKGTGDSVALNFAKEATIDHIVLREDLLGGEKVRKFIVEGQRVNGKWMTLVRGTQIGNRQIFPIAATAVSSVRLTVQESAAPVVLRELSVFNVQRPVPPTAFREGGRTALKAPGISRSRDGVFAIDSPSPDWEIRYTLDGSEPTRQSSLYREPQALPLGGVLKTRYFDKEDAAAPGGPVATRHFGLPQGQITVLRASSAAPENPAVAAFDGDGKTIWHTPWGANLKLPPHEIVVDMGQKRAVSGLNYLARQDAVGCFPKSLRVWVSDSENFAEAPHFSANFDDFKKEPHAWRTMPFAQVAAGRFVKIQFPAGLDAQYVATAELEILVGDYQVRSIEGSTVFISNALLNADKDGLEKALDLLQKQLAEIERAVPAPALAKLREVPLWFSPEYPGIGPRAEYHPGAAWLRDNKRNPLMAKGVEFTNVRIFEAETRRMPNFALHELAHAYHDRVLGFERAEINAAYQRAKTSQTYDKVERWHGNGRPNTHERAYAMSNAKEYFAECSEAFFARNDFFPFTREELQKHDPPMFALLQRLWSGEAKAE